MAALTAGTKAPGFSLTGIDGKNFSLQEALQRGPVVAAFFKISCPVCQYAFPFFERLYRAHRAKASFVAISQDNANNTSGFLREYGVTFQTLFDDPNGYAASNAYGLTNVPTWFLIGKDGTIELSSVGWSRKHVEELNRRLGEVGKSAAVPLFHAGEDVRDFRAG
ncbi:MAG TPA: TlpA disulfide reductase family protein [Terriglobales bacterium]|nr:TlpA disulfide reductase family protein [Terriglobales bacterium]